MFKKSLSLCLSVLLLFTLAIPALASGVAEADITASPFSEFTVRYSNITKSARVDLVLSRDIDVTAAKNYYNTTTINDFKTAHTGSAPHTAAARAAEAGTKSLMAVQGAYTNCAMSLIEAADLPTVDLSAELGAEYTAVPFTEAFNMIVENNLTACLPAGVDMFAASELAKGNFFGSMSYSDLTDRGDTILRYLSSFNGDPTATARYLDILTAEVAASAADSRVAYKNAADAAARKEITALLGERLNISLDYTDGVNDISKTVDIDNIDYLFDCDTGKPCSNLLEALIKAADGETDCVITLKAGTRYAFAVDLTDAELANAATMSATVNAYELSEDGGYAEHTLKAAAEEQAVAVTGFTDGAWVESEEPITVTAEGIEHFLSVNPYSASNSLIPVRWYLDGDAANAVEIAEGEYTFALNKRRMEGGEHTLTVVFEHKYYNYPEITTDDSLTESVTLSFTANTFKFAEVLNLLANIEGMIIGILKPLIEIIGGLFG